MEDTFKKGLEWIKKHPFIAVVGIGAMLLLLLYASSGGSTASASGTTSPGDVPPNQAALDAAEIQSATQLSEANIAANVQNTNTGAALTANSQNDALQALEAQLSAALGSQQIGTQSALAENQLADQTSEFEALILENAKDPRWVSSAFGTDTPPGSLNLTQLEQYDQASGA